MANHYECPHCGTHNKVKSFTEKLGENIPTTLFGAAVSLFATTISLGLSVVVAGAGLAYAAIKWRDGYTVTCHHCRKSFQVDG